MVVYEVGGRGDEHQCLGGSRYLELVSLTFHLAVSLHAYTRHSFEFRLYAFHLTSLDGDVHQTIRGLHFMGQGNIIRQREIELSFLIYLHFPHNDAIRHRSKGRALINQVTLMESGGGHSPLDIQFPLVLRRLT